MTDAGHDAAEVMTSGMRSALNERLAGDGPHTNRRRLVDATRAIIDELLRTTASEEDLQLAEDLVEQAAALLLLRDRTHGRDYVDVAEGSLAQDRTEFLDFSPFIGGLNPLAPPITVSFDDENNVIGTCTYGSPYEGPPGCVHGGFIAAGFDEILGFAQGQSGHPGMTANLTVNYRSPTPLHREVRYVGRFDRVDGRKIYTSATLSDGDRLCAEAEGLFVAMRPEVLEQLLRLRVGDASLPTTPG